MANLVELRNALRRATYADEESCVGQLLQQAIPLAQATRAVITEQASDLIKRARREREKRGALDPFLEEFDLSTQEGIALMCLAEALLRIPDSNTADALIAEKLRAGDWGKHRGHSDSPFVNASVWGMVMTGKIITLDQTITGTNHWFRNLVSRIGEPVVRKAILQSMRLMSDHYVLGRTIQEAMKRGPKENPPVTLFSFDMLGEGARNDSDACRYFESYRDAIQAIASKTIASKTLGSKTVRSKNSTQSKSVIAADGISIKLSALHARYQQTRRAQLLVELLPRVHALAVAARNGGKDSTSMPKKAAGWIFPWTFSKPWRALRN